MGFQRSHLLARKGVSRISVGKITIRITLAILPIVSKLITSFDTRHSPVKRTPAVHTESDATNIRWGLVESARLHYHIPTHGTRVVL